MANGLAVQARNQSDANSLLLARAVPTVAGLGDSITDRNSDPLTAGAVTFNSSGDIVWARALLNGRFYFSDNLNFGVTGQNTTQIRARVGSVIAAKPGYCRVLGGTNDAVTGVTYDPTVTWTNLKAIYDALIAAGIVVIACPILPRSYALSTGTGTAPELAAAQKGWMWVNRMIRRYAAMAASGSFYVMDADLALLNQANNSFIPIALMTVEGLHPIAAGAYRTGMALANALNALLPPARLTNICQQETYDATLNPLGTRLPNSQMVNTGTPGTNGTGVTGTAASGWAPARTTGANVTAVASIETVDAVTGEGRQVLTLGGTQGSGSTGNSDVISISRNLNVGATAYTPGETLIAECEIEGVGLAFVRNIALRVSDQGGATIKYIGMNFSGTTLDRLPATLPKVLVQTPLIPVASDSTIIVIAIEIGVDASTSTGGVPAGAVKIGHVTLRTPDPVNGIS